MKKLEKLNSKLFQEFEKDAISELASVVGGVKTKSVGEGTPHCEDVYDWGSNPSTDGTTVTQTDMIHSDWSADMIAQGGGSEGGPTLEWTNVDGFLGYGHVTEFNSLQSFLMPSGTEIAHA